MKKDLNKILSYTTLDGSCLNWTRCVNTDGYPRAVIDGYNNAKVHRVVYGLATGEDITGKVIRHTCDNPLCINPDHLVAGTVKDNVNDMDKRGRRGHAKLNKDQVQAIRDLYATGKYKKVALAKMFSISAGNIGSIVRFQSWKNAFYWA